MWGERGAHRKKRCTSAMHRATTALWEGFVKLAQPNLHTVSNVQWLDADRMLRGGGGCYGNEGAGHLRVALTEGVEEITEACKRIVRLAERV